MKSLYTSSSFLIALLLTPLFSIAQNVGVGTTTPASKLGVKGNLSIGNNYSGTTAPTDGAIIEGKVGIGLSTPTGKLHVRTSVLADTTSIIEHTNPDGYALKVKGEMDVIDAIRNTGSNFAGSVAINDGLTVGNIVSSTSCTPSISDSCSLYFWDGLTNRPYVFNIEPESPIYNATEHIRTYNTVSCNKGDCRNITKVKMKATFYEQGPNPVNVAAFLRGTLAFNFLKSNVMGSLPANQQPFDTIAIFIDSTNLFNNTDPIGNWTVRLISTAYYDLYDSDGIHEYTVNIYYKHANTTTTGGFAAYGEVKASGSLFANSSHEYGDVAEFMKVQNLFDYEPEAGDLISIDPNNPQSFILSSKANDPLLVGAISKNPSLFINSPEAGKPIALTGRVEVKVNSEGGFIKPGDPITSSSVPGIGMKMNQSGTVLGYAMEAFDGSRTSTGKIWILLARGHYEGLDKNIKIIEGKTEEVGGLQIQGVKKVNNEKEIFVEWRESVIDKLPSDIDFDDIVISLNPFGGSANLIVKEVSNNGFLVSISKKSSSFKGFYYSADFVSPMLFKETEMVKPIQSDNNSETKTIQNSVSVQDDVKSLYQEWKNKTQKLIEKSGRSNAGLVAQGLSPYEVVKIKKEVTESWRKADKKTYEERLAIGLKLDELLNKNPNIKLVD